MSKKIKKFLILPLLLILIFSYPLKLSFGAGPGSCTVSPSEVVSGSTKDFVFTYTATQRMPGGTVKINIKDPFTAPQKNSANPGYVEIGETSPNCIIGRTLDNMDDSTLWYSKDWSKISLSSDTTSTNKKEGYASLKLTILPSANTDDYIYNTNINIPSEVNRVSFWIKPSVQASQGDLQFGYDNDADFLSPIITPIPALPANTWSYIRLSISPSSEIKSIGFIYNVDFMTSGGTIWIDEILIESTELSIVGRDIYVRILDMQNGDYFKIEYNNVKAPTVTVDTQYTFKTETRADPSITLSEISPSPVIKVLKPPSATKLIYTSSYKPSTYDNKKAGEWAGPIEVQRLDASDKEVKSGNLVVSLSTTSPKGKFSTTISGAYITQITIPDGSDTAQFYYYDETAGVWTITASAQGLTSAVDNITIDPNITGPTKYIITLPGETFESGKGNTGTPTNQTAGITFQIRVRYVDQYNNLITGSDGTGQANLIFSGPNCSCGTNYKPKYNSSEVSNCGNTEATVNNVNFTNGVSDPINVSLYKSETIAINVKNSVYSTITGNSSQFNVVGSTLKNFSIKKLDDGNLSGTFTAGEIVGIKIKALDEYCNPTKITGTVDLILLDNSDNPVSPPPLATNAISTTSVTFSNEMEKVISDFKIYRANDNSFTNNLKIRAKLRVSTEYGDSGEFKVKHNVHKKFIFDNISSPQLINTNFSITIKATDEWGNICDDYNGASHYSGIADLSTNIGPGTITPTNTGNFSNGKITLNNVKINQPGTSVTITAKDQTDPTKSGTSNSFAVFGNLASFEISYIGDQTINNLFTITIKAKDSIGNILTQGPYANITFSLSAEGSVSSHTVSPDSATLNGGIWTGNISVNTPPDPNVRIKITYGSVTSYSNYFRLSDSVPSSFDFENISSPKIAGTPFSITIRAVDYYDSPVTNYNGTATLSASTGAGTISPTSITFTNGVYTGNVTLTTPNPSVVLTCFDSTTGAMGTSNAFQVTGGVESFRFSTISSPQYKNENIYISIQAVDINGDIVTGFNGTVNLSSTAGTITPTSANFVGGMWSGNVKINGEGQNIRVQATYSSKTGFSDPFTILPFSQLVFEPIISSPQYVDVPFSITVKAKTPSGAPGTWSGTLSLSCSLGNDKIDKNSLTMTNGTVTDNVKISQRATGVTLTVQTTIYGSTISGTSNVFEVKEGNKLAFITEEQVIPIDTASGDIKVQIQDQDGNPVTASANVTVNLTSSSTTGRFSTDKNTWSTSSSHSVTIPSGQNQVTFYYKDTSPGLHTLTAKATGLRDGTQTIRVSVDGSGECKISPDSAFVRETNKDFTLTFTSKATMDGGEIQITIPSAFSSPQKTSPAGEGYISITAGSGVTIGDLTITGYNLNIPINIMPKDRTITINYKKVTCPSATGDYTFDVKTKGPGGSLTSIATLPKVTITLTTVSDVKVSIDPSSASAFSEYTITFKTSTVGQLLSNIDKIYIKFPTGTEIPGVIDAQDIQINTVALTSPPSIDVPKREVTLITPVDIGASSDVTIKFTAKAKLKNPSTTGTNYQIELWTDKDPTHKLSTAYSITSKTNVVNLTVSINPPGANSYGDITIGFKISNALVKDVHTITLIFPSGFDVPPNISPNLITVGGTALTDAPTIDSGTRTITMVTPRDFSKAGTVEVIISKDAKIKNPSKAGKYKLTVYTSQDSTPVDSPLFDILSESQIKDVKCSVNPPTINKVSRWEISFKTGTLGGLSIGSKIWIEFPGGTTIPGTIPSGSVSVDGLPAVTQKILSLKIEITTPKEILPNSTVNIVITEDAGIKNPSSPSSTYKIKLSTTTEQTPVESDVFTIYQPPSSSHKIDPATSNGLSGYYITKPVITITAASNYDTSPKIYYKWGTEQYRLYTGPLTAPEGVNKLYYYSEDKFGNIEDEHTVEIKVDTVPPVISLVEPKDGSFVKDKMVTVVISSQEELLDVTLNNEKMTKGAGLRWSLTITVKEGENILVVKGRDLAGNSAEISFKIYLDTTPPVVKITSPASNQVVTTRNIKLTGETDPNSKVNLKITGVIGTIFEGDVNSDSQGKFEFDLTKLPPGFIGITATATDPAGNVGKATLQFIHKQTIFLWIGKPEAQIDDESTFVDPDNKSVTPFILPPGRTMVPIRFISEAFGAKVEWFETTRTVKITWGSKTIELTIGVYTAKVDGKDVKLDAPPLIKEGRTFVPIRFISEAFNAVVDWNSKEQKVTVTL